MPKTAAAAAADAYMLASTLCHGGGTPVYPTRRERHSPTCIHAWRRYCGFVALLNRRGAFAEDE
jgi:hypothetical protein